MYPFWSLSAAANARRARSSSDGAICGGGVTVLPDGNRTPPCTHPGADDIPRALGASYDGGALGGAAAALAEYAVCCGGGYECGGDGPY